MKRFVAGLIVATSALMPAATGLAQTAYPVGVVNLRGGPGLEYAVVGTLGEGERAAVLSHTNAWLKVRTESGLVGYMADWVTREVFDDTDAWVQVNTDILNVRSGAGTEFDVIGQVQQGQRFRLLEGLGAWAKIDAGSLGLGWVSNRYVYRVAAPPASQPPATPPPETPGPERSGGGPAKAVAAAEATTMYAGRDPRFAAVASVSAGETLAYVTSAEGWVKVQRSSGEKGWVDGHDLYLWDRDIDFTHQATYHVVEDDWSLQFLRVREVVEGGAGLRLRAGPSTDSAILHTLSYGDRLKLLAVPGGEFVQVMLPGGLTGWLSRNWIKPVTGLPTESVRLYRAAEGVLRLEVTGQTGTATLLAKPGALEVGLPPLEARRAGLQIGEHDVAEVLLGATGLTVRFDQPFAQQVVEQSSSRTVVEFRPLVRKVEQLSAPDRRTYRLQTTGSVVPSVRQDGGAIVLTLPGARLDATLALGSGDFRLVQTPEGVTGRITTAQAYAVRTGTGVVDLVLYAPGLTGKVIVIDPGHGGVETGAIGAAGLQEKEANLGIALKLKGLLEAAGARVLMTHSSDSRCATAADLANLQPEEHLRYDLNCRATVANTGGADAFVSIHNNGNPDTRERGTETYWTAENRNASRSQALAALVQQELLKGLGLSDRGVKAEMFYVIKYTEAPAVLAEVAFVSNPSEETALKRDDFRQRTAEGFARALAQFFK